MARLKKQNRQKEAEGVWVRFDEIRFKIARLGNPKYEQIQEAQAAENTALREAGKPVKDWKQNWLDILSQAVLIGWEGLEGDDGAPIAYTPEKARELLADPAYSDFKRFVETEAANRENFIERGEAATEKNSQALSSQISASAETSAVS